MSVPKNISGSWATIGIINSLSAAGSYFGGNVSDDDIWLFLNADPGGLQYLDNTGSVQSYTAANPWLQLSQIQDRCLYASAGTSNAAVYAVIYSGGVAPPACPTPAPPPTTSTDYAYAALEWDFSVAGYQNADIQNIDQFSYVNTLMAIDQTGNIKGRAGYTPGTLSETVLGALLSSYGSGACVYPNPADFPQPTNQQQYNCSAPTSATDCYGLPSDYESAAEMGRMTQQVAVATNLVGLSQPPYRWVGSSKSQLQTIPGTFTTVLQLFGAGFNAYLKSLYAGAPNSADGYYLDYSGNGGYSCYFNVTMQTEGADDYYGITISQIRINTGQAGGADVDQSAGTALSGEITILPNGAPLLNQPVGCGGAAMNQYGLWTDRVIGTGATPDCDGVFGAGPVVTTTITDSTSSSNQSLIATIIATLSTALNYGLITPTWLTDGAMQGTNYYFGNINQSNTSALFQAGASNADAWTETLWKFQDLSNISGSLNNSPIYISTFGDRFSNMSPQLEPLCLQSAGATLVWFLGDRQQPATATAIANMQDGVVLGVQVLNGGGAYLAPPAVTIESSGNGATATAVAVVEDGVVIAINVTNAGSEYQFSPQVTIAAPF